MGRDLGPVTRAMSHEQALGQCRGWLRANHISPVAHSDTAGAAAWVADSDEVGLAALEPPHAADLHGLTLHRTGQEDADHTMTRFVDQIGRAHALTTGTKAHTQCRITP